MPWLDVERHGVLLKLVRALQIAKLNKLIKTGEVWLVKKLGNLRNKYIGWWEKNGFGKWRSEKVPDQSVVKEK